MLNHFNTIIIFFIALFTVIFIDQTEEVNKWWYVAIIVPFLAIEFYGAAFIQSGFHIKAVCRANTSEKVIALSFDDGPDLNTHKILDVLKRHDIKAAFFCIGKKIAGHEDILKRADSEGHTIGNHSFSHDVFYDLKSAAYFIGDLTSTANLVREVIGKKPLLFRPPYGVTTPGLASAVKKLGFDVVGWNIRSLDTKIKDKAELLKRIKNRVRPGSVLLMHDTVAGIETVLEELITWLKKENYTIVEPSKMLNLKNYDA